MCLSRQAYSPLIPHLYLPIPSTVGLVLPLFPEALLE